MEDWQNAATRFASQEKTPSPVIKTVDQDIVVMEFAMPASITKVTTSALLTVGAAMGPVTGRRMRTLAHKTAKEHLNVATEGANHLKTP